MPRLIFRDGKFKDSVVSDDCERDFDGIQLMRSAFDDKVLRAL